MSTTTERPSRILVLDDEQLNIELLRFILEKNGYLFRGATQESDFMHALEDELPDLILLDVLLGDTEGFDVCLELKKDKRFADIPVIFLTGKVGVEDKIRGFEVGGVDYVTKPFNEQELIARMNTHLSLIFARKRIENQALKLEKSNQLKDRLFSIIGHDLRSPLSAAKLKMDFILRGIIDPTAENFKEETVYGLLKTMDEALNLLQNLLGWAKSESGELQAIPENISLNDIVEETFRLLRLASDHKSIEMRNEVPEGTEVYADLNMIKTVLRNFLSNAIKFTPDSGRIRVATQEDTHGMLWVRIIDNGQGISREDIAKILNPDEHFSKLGTQKEPGTGLGLILCQAFIGVNGGEMRIDSKPGEGSTFLFSIPTSSIAELSTADIGQPENLA